MFLRRRILVTCHWPVVLILALALRFAFAQEPSRILLVHTRLDDRWSGEVWSVDPKGAAFPILEFSPESVGSGGVIDSLSGSTLPRPAPDGRALAYVQDDDLWILDARTKESRRLTDVNADCREGDLRNQVRLTGWSPDSSELLYQIARADGPNPFAEYVRCPAAYGFYRFDAATGAIARTAFPDDDRSRRLQYQAFLGEGSFLVTHGLDVMILVREALYPITTIGGIVEWADLSSSGRYASFWFLAERGDSQAQILKLQLDTGALVTISSGTDRLLGRSKLSPDGRRTAYESHVPIDEDPTGHKVMIDGRAVLTGVPLDFEWFDENRLAVLLREPSAAVVLDSIVIVDAESGETVSKTTLTK
jgi:hypothetical protein